jgi:hypothetical protein
LGFFDHGLVPDTDSKGQTDTFTRKLDHLINQYPSTLTDEGHIACVRSDHAFTGYKQAIGKRGRIDAEAIGPYKGKAGFFGYADHAILKVFSTRFGKSPRNDHSTPDLCPDAIGQDVGAMLGTDSNDGQINPFRDF